MKIGEFSKRTDLPASTLHFYERLGMLIAHRDRVLDEMARWQENLSHLDDKIAYYESEIEKA